MTDDSTSDTAATVTPLATRDHTCVMGAVTARHRRDRRGYLGRHRRLSIAEAFAQRLVETTMVVWVDEMTRSNASRGTCPG